MSKDAISDYSATAGSNTDVGGVNVNEGCPPSGINNAIRELMSHLADLNAGSSSLGTIKVDNLQLDANAITSTNTNGDIAITPNGTGDVVIDGLKHPQADGTANHFLKTDGSAQLSFAQVDTASIAADAIDGTKIADDAIDSEHYTDGSIDTQHIADNAVTLAKMASGTDGNIISFDASGNPVAVATGSAGQVLTSAGAGAPPTFATAGGGAGMEFIVSSGAISNAASVTFTQFDASKYDHYAFYFQHIIPVTDNVFLFGHHSTDGGSSFDTTSGDYHSNGSVDRVGFFVSNFGDGVGSDTNEFGTSGLCHLYSPHTAAFTMWDASGTVTQILDGSVKQGGSATARLAAENTDAIKFAFTSGNIESGEITMFGIVNS